MSIDKTVDEILEKGQNSLATNKPETRVKIRSAQVDAMSLRYNKSDLTMCRVIIKELTEGIAEGRYTGNTLVMAVDTLEMAYCIGGYWDLELYFYALEFRRDPKKRYYEPRRRIMKPIADEITNLIVNDKYDTLVLNLPPRVGKSTMGIMACSWVGGREPTKQNLLTGYAAALTSSFYKELNVITQDGEYNYSKVFRDIRRVGQSAEWTLIDYADKNSKRVEIARYPTFACRAIGASLNGQVEAAGLLYCDDLTRGYEESLSLDQMDKLYAQYTSDLVGRAKEGFKEFHIGTRWSLHDPLGRIITSNGDSERFKLIQIPALDKITDESNFNFDNGVGFSTEFYRERRRVLQDDKEQNGAVTWMCLYQQEAIERGSLLFPEENLKRFNPETLEGRKPDLIASFVDLAFGGRDYLSMPIAYVYKYKNDEGVQKNKVFIVDWVFLRGDYNITQPLVYAKIREWGISRIEFESNNGGDFYRRDIMKMLDKDGGPSVRVTGIRQGGNQTKMNRIEANEPDINSFEFLEEIWYNEMYRTAMKNTTTFSRDGINKNDDGPDSLAGLAAMLRVPTTNKAKILSRTYL